MRPPGERHKWVSARTAAIALHPSYNRARMALASGTKLAGTIAQANHVGERLPAVSKPAPG